MTVDTNTPLTIFWFRRDLRISDNAGLYHALNGGISVLPLFIFDTSILNLLSDKKDARVNFIHQQLQEIKKKLCDLNSDILIEHGTPEVIFERLFQKYNIKKIYTNHDYEPSAIERDEKIKNIALKKGVEFLTFKDHVIFEKDEIQSATFSPYKVYTPYKNKWLSLVNGFYLKAYPTEKYVKKFAKINQLSFPSLEQIGFQKTSIAIPPTTIAQGIIKKYHEQRDFPFIEGTSRLGIHFRFGSISIREKARKAQSLNEVWLSELIWRDFFSQLMFHFPHVVNESFQPKFKRILWRTDEADFNRWCEGTTGYPMVDAGMRELNETGHMHNRVRMVVASFLTKHLFIDWRWGEAYFAEKLLDYDLASNNGNWQWCAGTGADAQPYFRIFNPTAQQEKFDPNFIYIKKWVPEFGTSSYPKPMIDHKMAVARAKEGFSILSK